MRWMILSALVFAACGDAGPEPETTTLSFDGGPADTLDGFRVRADGMTVWADPAATNDVQQDRWTLGLRTSHSIATATATVAGSRVEVVQVSARKFEVSLKPEQLTANLTDEPLLVTVETTTGKTFTINVGLTARFRNTAGSSRIYLWQNITPVVVANDVVFRGKVTTRGEFDTLVGSNDDDSEPVSSKLDATHWALDFPKGALVWAASPPEDALDVHGDIAGVQYHRSAPIAMELSRLGVTNADPSHVWPAPTCPASTQACVDAAGLGADLAHCGRARDVLACALPADPAAELEPWKKRFADDFRRALIAYYGQYGADVVGSGGNTQQQALLAVDTRRIDEVTDPDEDPQAHDLTQVRVFRHPDVTYPGSDIVWFAAYDRVTGQLVGRVYDFN